MYKFILVVVLVVSLITLGAYLFLQSGTPNEDVLQGTVRYNERIALLPGSFLKVELRDQSTSKESPITLATYEYTTTGENIPLPFSLSYNPRDISRKGSYVLYAELSVGGVVRFTTDTPVPVLTSARPPEGVDVLLIAISEETDETKQVATASQLQNTAWIWNETKQGEDTLVPASDKFVLSFAENSVMSRTDCNGLSGTYIVAENNLTFSPFASTLMFCEESQEAEYVGALARATSFVRENQSLILNLEGGGTMLFTETIYGVVPELTTSSPEATSTAQPSATSTEAGEVEPTL